MTYPYSFWQIENHDMTINKSCLVETWKILCSLKKSKIPKFYSKQNDNTGMHSLIFRDRMRVKKLGPTCKRMWTIV